MADDGVTFAPGTAEAIESIQKHKFPAPATIVEIPDDCLTADEIIEYAKSVVAELNKSRDKMYAALDVLPVTDFESRDALNHEIAASIGEQRAWRKITEWVEAEVRSERV